MMDEHIKSQITEYIKDSVENGKKNIYKSIKHQMIDCMLDAILQKNKFKQEKTAKELGISRVTLSRFMKERGLLKSQNK